jgi:hypothetical protein
MTGAPSPRKCRENGIELYSRVSHKYCLGFQVVGTQPGKDSIKSRIKLILHQLDKLDLCFTSAARSDTLVHYTVYPQQLCCVIINDLHGRGRGADTCSETGTRATSGCLLGNGGIMSLAKK